MSSLSVESLPTLDDAVISEIGPSLAPDDPQVEMFAEQMASLHEITATPATFFVARSEGHVVGYGRVRERTPNGDDWMFDVILVPRAQIEVEETALAIFQCAQNECRLARVEWWTRGIGVSVGGKVAPLVGLHRHRTIVRMEIDFDQAPEPHPVPTRAFTLDDAAAVVRVNNEVFAGHPDRSNIDIARLMNDLESSGNNYADLRVIEDKAGIAGFVWVKEQFGRYGELYVLALDRAHQGQGMGTHLLDAAMVYLRETYSPKRALLYVESTNTHAISLYRRYGFEDVHQPLVSFSNR